MSNIAIFASGSGTNAENIMRYFSTRPGAKVSLVLSNRHDAMVLKRAETHNVETMFFDRDDFYVSGKVLAELRKHRIDLVVLAGFLWLVPSSIIEEYAGRIINIHPALLPKYGGKGMYGDRVHKAVIDAGEKTSGITIHYVNGVYDAGDIIFQAECSVTPDDTPATLASKVHALEYRYFPEVIENLLSKL